MINIAVFLKSESCDNYLYLYSVEKAQDVVDKLILDNCEFEGGYICDYDVESNDAEFNNKVLSLISEYLDNRIRDSDEDYFWVEK